MIVITKYCPVLKFFPVVSNTDRDTEWKRKHPARWINWRIVKKRDCSKQLANSDIRDNDDLMSWRTGDGMVVDDDKGPLMVFSNRIIRRSRKISISAQRECRARTRVLERDPINGWWRVRVSGVSLLAVYNPNKFRMLTSDSLTFLWFLMLFEGYSQVFLQVVPSFFATLKLMWSDNISQKF